MPNGILKEPYPKANHQSGDCSSHHGSNPILDRSPITEDVGQQQSKVSNRQLSAESTQQHDQPQANILNVAEMLLHGVADNEILTIWLQSIACQEFARNFLNAGYDMPTISRITPQDLTAIGITDPAKRLKMLSEIKKLNLQDGIPNFKPANLSHFLSLLRLDSHYLDSLCDQQIDTIDKMCQLTWEDFEDLGITKLGHQKRMLLAIERMKELDSNEAKATSKSISEPIYDTNPSQILLVASAENHSMNGPIINKQSSTSELSSTGSGSLHSVYSANSIQYQATYAALPTIQQQPDQNSNQHNQQQAQISSNQTKHQQVIYSQPPSQMALHQVPLPQVPLQLKQPVPNMPLAPASNLHSSHYQANQPMQMIPPNFISPIYDPNNKRNTMAPQTNRQSLNHLPLSALANLPKHQQQLLQQSFIYATLGRQPQKAKQQPPPVPVRTNSLKSSSLINEIDRQQSQNLAANINISSSQNLSQTQTNSSSNLFRSGAQKSQFNSQTLITKNKSFSGNAYMDAARARFLNRNNHNHQLQQPTLYHHMHSLANQECVNTNQNDTRNLIYEVNSIRCNLANRYPTANSDNLSIYSRQSLTTSDRSNTFNHHSSDIQALKTQQYQQRLSLSTTKSQASTNSDANFVRVHSNEDNFDPNSDTNSTKSLILQPTSATSSPLMSSRQTSIGQDDGSSLTLYNSASSGSNDQSVNGCNLSQSGRMASHHSITSNSTLNDVNLTLDQQTVYHQQNDFSTRDGSARLRGVCNATTGKDDDFPPPPSPLALTHNDELELLSDNTDKNFNDINRGLMAFKIGM